MLCKAFQYDLNRMRTAEAEEYTQVDGIGEVLAGAIVEYFHDETKEKELSDLMSELTLEKTELPQERPVFDGMNFVVTGSVTRFKNRNELKAYIEERGGKVTGSVTSKTDYLINNDTTSGSSKNKKAKELNVPILSEEDF